MAEGEMRMKCPVCCGEGSVPYQLDDDLFDETFCEKCDGTGEITTWEEFIRTCTRKELAILIYSMHHFDAVIDSACDPETPDYRESVNEAYEWLQTECKIENWIREKAKK